MIYSGRQREEGYYQRNKWISTLWKEAYENYQGTEPEWKEENSLKHYFSNFNGHTYHLNNLDKIQILTQWVWGGALLTNSVSSRVAGPWATLRDLFGCDKRGRWKVQVNRDFLIWWSAVVVSWTFRGNVKGDFQGNTSFVFGDFFLVTSTILEEISIW